MICGLVVVRMVNFNPCTDRLADLLNFHCKVPFGSLQNTQTICSRSQLKEIRCACEARSQCLFTNRRSWLFVRRTTDSLKDKPYVCDARSIMKVQSVAARRNLKYSRREPVGPQNYC